MVSVTASMFLLVASVPAADAIKLYIAADGNDTWTGRLQTPNNDHTNGPFRTLERGRDEIRKLTDDTKESRSIDVIVSEGTYFLEQPFSLTHEDSGQETRRITYRSAPGEKVVLSGGRELKNWTPVGDPDVTEMLTPEARGVVACCSLEDSGIRDLGDPTSGNRPELFLDGQPLPLARWPNEGFVRIESLTGNDPIDSHGLKGDKFGRFTIAADRISRWQHESDLRVHGYWFWDWSDSYASVEGLDPSKREIRLGGTPHHYGYRAGQRFYVLNALTELDAPGEWYIDRVRKQIYFWPPKSTTNSRIVLSLLPELVKATDTSSGHIFERLSFEACRGTAITVSGGVGLEVIGCQLVDIGGAGISMTGKKHAVRGCDLVNLGDSGISITAGDRKTLTPGEGSIENNHVHHFARLRKTYAPAIGVSGVGQQVRNNLIHDGPHCAILLSGNEHLLEMNEIHHVCKETGDVGAFYMGRDWSMRGNVIRHNYFHHIQGPGLHGAMAVYLDDAASGTIVFGNVFYQAGRAAFIGGGRDNRVINNVFVDCTPSVHVDARGFGWMRDHIEDDMPRKLKELPYQSPPWSEKYPELLTLFDGDPGAPTGNVIARNISVGGRWKDIEEVAAPLVKLEGNLVDRDPHFVDQEARNFQLRDDSPAYRLGFQRIPFERIGLIPNSDRATWQAKQEKSSESGEPVR